MWCKSGQNLDYKICVCKNKLVGRIIGECTSVMNETMMNNRDNEDNDNTIKKIFIGLFSVLLFVGIVCFCVLAYFKWIKDKKLFKKNILIIDHINDWDDIFFINDFEVNSLEIIKRKSRIGANIYHIRYVLDPDYDYNAIKPLYFLADRLIGYIEEIEGSSDKYLVVASSVRNKYIINVLSKIWGSIENKIEDILYPFPNNYPNIKIKDFDKFRFNSDIDLPLDTSIEFRSLVINISCVIEKDNEYYPEIYLDKSLYIKDNPCPHHNLFL